MYDTEQAKNTSNKIIKYINNNITVVIHNSGVPSWTFSAKVNNHLFSMYVDHHCHIWFNLEDGQGMNDVTEKRYDH